jgi:predicted transcriptional regulator
MPTPDLTNLLGFRQAQIMQLFWTHGPTTVRELHTMLTADAPLSYNAVLTMCSRLHEKGLLERQRVIPGEVMSRAKQAYVYCAQISEVDLLRPESDGLPQPPVAGMCHHVSTGSERASVEHLLAYLGTLHDTNGHAIDDRALDTVVALLERAESAERAIFIYQAEALRAAHRAASADQAELRCARAKPVPASAVYDYPGEHKICRVCGRPAPPPHGIRRNALRVCSLDACRQEARRRDNVTKQRRSVARKRAQKA